MNNKVVWNIVDANGNKVALGDNKAVSIDEVKYIVTSKPEGAKVSTYDATIKSDLINKGEGRVAITSDTKGDVTVQVVLKQPTPRPLLVPPTPLTRSNTTLAPRPSK